jgi:hypothetical protein
MNPWPVASWVARVLRKERKTIIKIPGALCLNPCGDKRPLCSNPGALLKRETNEKQNKHLEQHNEGTKIIQIQ